MSCNNVQGPPALARQAGLTLIEMLVAAAVSLIIFGVLLSMLVSTGNVQARSQLQLGVDESMRAALELISMDLRESVGPRVVVGPASALPPGMGAYSSSSSSLTVTRMDSANILAVREPPGYPGSQSYTNSGSTRVVSTNAAAKSCATIFSGGAYALVTDGAQSTWLKLHDTTPCGIDSGVPTVVHPNTMVTFPYSPQTTVGRVDAVQYAIRTINGVSTLTRQVVGSGVQVVALDITGLQVEYSADGATFSATPQKPRALRVTLIGQGVRGQRRSNLTLSTTVFMRDITVPAPVAGL